MTPRPAAAAATVLRRLGMVPVAYDCDWPPCIDWATDAAYVTAAQRITELETERGLSPPHAGKEHLGRIRRRLAVK